MGLLSHFLEKTFRDGRLCQYAEPISELYFRGFGDADGHTIQRKNGRLAPGRVATTVVRQNNPVFL
jgi:hypothetical protein